MLRNCHREASMAVHPTYPGVYIEEIPSGVRAIAGVSTSVAAFIGAAKLGAVLRAQHVFANSDYERLFGGLDQNSAMFDAVPQSSLNGGSEAWIVRVAGSSASATATAAPLNFTAQLGGFSGNAITAYVDYQTPYPDSTFNLTFVYRDPYNATAAPVTESFANLSMNPSDPRYLRNAVNAGSSLAQGAAGPPTLNSQTQSIGGVLTLAGLKTAFPANAGTKSFNISLAGDAPLQVNITPATAQQVAAAATLSDALTAIATAIQGQVKGARPGNQYTNFGCAVVASGKALDLTINPTVATDSIRILAGSPDAAGPLKLGSQNGGQDIDATAGARPKAVPPSGTLLGGPIDETMSITAGTLGIALDGDATVQTVTLGDH